MISSPTSAVEHKQLWWKIADVIRAGKHWIIRTFSSKVYRIPRGFLKNQLSSFCLYYNTSERKRKESFIILKKLQMRTPSPTIDKFYINGEGLIWIIHICMEIL